MLLQPLRLRERLHFHLNVVSLLSWCSFPIEMPEQRMGVDGYRISAFVDKNLDKVIYKARQPSLGITE